MNCGMNNAEILRRLGEIMAVMEAAGKRIDELKAENVALRQADVGKKRELMKNSETLYYLQDARSYVGNCPLWWAPNGNGYTTDLRKAHRYTLAEAMRRHQYRDTDLPWLCGEIDQLQRSTIDAQDMHKMRDAQEQKAALQAAYGIKG